MFHEDSHTGSWCVRSHVHIQNFRCKIKYSGEVQFKNDDDCRLDGGSPQCQFEGIERLEVRWIHLQCIPLSAGASEEGGVVNLRTAVWIHESAAMTSGSRCWLREMVFPVYVDTRLKRILKSIASLLWRHLSCSEGHCSSLSKDVMLDLRS